MSVCIINEKFTKVQLQKFNYDFASVNFRAEL